VDDLKLAVSAIDLLLLFAAMVLWIYGSGHWGEVGNVSRLDLA